MERIIIGSILNIRSLLGSQIVSNVTLLTRMAEVETILNDSRHTPPTSDSKDPSPQVRVNFFSNCCDQTFAFIPGNLATPIFTEVKGGSRPQCGVVDKFSKRLIQEYLPTFYVRQKWPRVRRNLGIRDIVLAIDENSPHGRRPKAVVHEVFSGRQGVIPQADVRQNVIFYSRTRLP